MTVEGDGMSEVMGQTGVACGGREQTHELTNLEERSVMAFSAVTFRKISLQARSCRRWTEIFPRSWVFKSDTPRGRTLTFSASTNADLGEQEPTKWGPDKCSRGPLCDRMEEKATLREYTKNNVARQLPEFPSVG